MRATCSPNTTKAMKLKKTAAPTAVGGRITRVDTTVAIELAESCMPLRRSNSSATATRADSTGRPGGVPCATGSDLLDHDALPDRFRLCGQDVCRMDGAMNDTIPRPADRTKRLDAERNRKMTVSAHAYVRGSTVRFYEWLEASRLALPDGPSAWICGDCQVGNLGPVASGDGILAIQIRDLDQTVIGNPVHDLIRLGLSLATAARGSDLPGVATAHMLERMTVGYETAFEADPERSHDQEATMPKIIRQVMRDAAGRSWKHLADERIEGLEPAIPLGKRFWPLRREERQGIEALFADAAMRRLVTTLRARPDDAPVRVLDAAYWRKGCSSLGRLRFAVLAEIGRGKAARHCLMDVKEAATAAAPRDGAAAMPQDDAERVVAGARALSPLLGGRMATGRLLDKPVFVRELLPQDLKLEIERLGRAEATDVAGFLAGVVGHAHARQLDAGDRNRWLRELRRRSGALDAPPWLWNGVVELVAAHEAAYLQHCRRFALDRSA